MRVRDRTKSDNLLKAFRESRKQILSTETKALSRGYSKNKETRQKESSGNYYKDYFLPENGIRYVIANRARDMALFKKLQTNYEPREICLMIEFLFNSKQDYLIKDSIQPTVLLSTWCNTIYQDSIKWANDEYKPRKKKVTKTREWTNESDEERTEIGVWE